jgi:hypothetical protein
MAVMPLTYTGATGWVRSDRSKGAPFLNFLAPVFPVDRRMPRSSADSSTLPEQVIHYDQAARNSILQLYT